MSAPVLCPSWSLTIDPPLSPEGMNSVRHFVREQRAAGFQMPWRIEFASLSPETAVEWASAAEWGTYEKSLSALTGVVGSLRPSSAISGFAEFEPEHEPEYGWALSVADSKVTHHHLVGGYDPPLP